MLPALLALLLLQVPDAGRVAALIRDLDAEEIAVRDQAQLDLLQIGEPALAPLEEALRESASEEVRARIPSIAAAIRGDARRKAFKGGKEVGGFSARVSIEERKDASILVTVEIMNVGAGPAPIPAALNGDFKGPGASVSSSGSHGRFTVRQLSGQPPEGGLGSRGCGLGPDRNSVMLAPGESKVATRVLNAATPDDGYRLGPGDYEVEFTYYANSRKLLVGAGEDLVSNRVKFTVAAP